MKTTYKDNTFTVVTDITKETVEAGFSNLRAKDKDGNEVYAVSVSKTGDAAITPFSMTGNAYIDGKLAAVIVMPMDTTLADVQKKYGESLVTADQYTKQIAEEAAAKEATIKAMFAE